MSGPIVEGVLRFSANARYMDKDGQYTNIVSGTKDMGGQRTKSVGAQLDWTPATWFDARLRMNYSEDTDQLPPQVHLVGPGTGITSDELLNCYQPQAGTRRRGYHCGTLPTLDFLAANTTSYEEAGLYPGRDAKQFSTNLVLNAYWRDYTFTSTSSFSDNSNYGASDQDFSAVRGYGGAFETFGWGGDEAWTQELRAISPQTSRLRWQAGLYMYEATPDSTSRGGNLVANPIPGQPDLPPVINTQTNDASTKNQAVFALVEFDLLDNLTLTAEGRYAEDTLHRGGVSNFNKSSNTGFVPGSYSSGCTMASAPTAGNPDRQTLACTNPWSNDSKFNNFLPRVTATWLQTDQLTWYAQYSKGNKPGGYNNSAENARTTPSDRADTLALGLTTYDEEEVDSYEVGFKSRLFDQRVQFNTALYLIDWKNQQLTQNATVDEEGRPVGGPQPQFAESYILNLGRSEIRGVEIEMLAALTEHWNLRMTYAYQDAKVKEFFSVDQSDLIFAGPYTPNCIEGTQCYADYEAAGDMKGYEMPHVPKNMGSVSLTARYPIGDRSTFHFRTDYSYEGSRYVQIHNLAKMDSAGVVNVTIGIERDAWNLSLWARNLTDDDTIVDVKRSVNPLIPLVVPQTPGLPGTVTRTTARNFAVSLADRRQFGMTLTYRFN